MVLDGESQKIDFKNSILLVTSRRQLDGVDSRLDRTKIEHVHLEHLIGTYDTN